MKSKKMNRVQMFILFGVVYLFVKCGYRPMKQWLIDGYVDWSAYSFGYTCGAALRTLAVLGGFRRCICRYHVGLSVAETEICQNSGGCKRIRRTGL